MRKLDEIAINIELVLISIVQGVALIKLAENAYPLLHDVGLWQYFPYILSALALLLAFWAQAILHAVSFIRWPIRMEHMFLYFVAAFVQVIMYINLSDIGAWFFWSLVFSLVVTLIYYVDLRVIKDMREPFARLPGGTDFLDTIEKRHRYEFTRLVPIAIAYNLIAFTLVWLFYGYFDVHHYEYAVLGFVQFMISLGALYDCVRNFNKRARLLPALFE